jgi:hypothetical protein
MSLSPSLRFCHLPSLIHKTHPDLNPGL